GEDEPTRGTARTANRLARPMSRRRRAERDNREEHGRNGTRRPHGDCAPFAGSPTWRRRMERMLDVVVIGAGPAGVVAALRAGDLGAKTALVTRGEFGGMAANDGPVPVRTLAHAARLIRESRQLGQYGIAVSEPTLEYRRLLVSSPLLDTRSG